MINELFTLEQSSMHLNKLLIFRWQAARFEYRLFLALRNKLLFTSKYIISYDKKVKCRNIIL